MEDLKETELLYRECEHQQRRGLATIQETVSESLVQPKPAPQKTSEVPVQSAPAHPEEVARQECVKVTLEDDGNGTAVAWVEVILGPGQANCLEFKTPLFGHSRTIDIRLPWDEHSWDAVADGFIPRGFEGKRRVFRREHFNGARADFASFRAKIEQSVGLPMNQKPTKIKVLIISFDMAAIR